MWLLLTLSACTNLPDDWTALEIGAALDYTIDRERVVAVRTEPAIVEAGDDVFLDALVLSPDRIGAVAADGCGLRDDVATDVTAVWCFEEPDLVFPMADALPETWAAPALDGPAFADCPVPRDLDASQWRDPCISTFPVMVTAGDALAHTVIDLRVGRDAEVPVPLHLQDVALTVAATAAPGDVVDLDLAWLPAAPLDGEYVQLETRWFVDDGVLERTGRTHVEPDGDAYVTFNRLHLSDDAAGPLRVFAVLTLVTPDPYADMGTWRDTAWRLATVEVTP